MNLVNSLVKNRLTQIVINRDHILSGIKSTEDDLLEQRVRLATIEKQVVELQTFLDSNKTEVTDVVL